tara:strand:+ start:319 stop:678 length:360 start_codon:yes stop_codon:yes gene_type:complete
VIKFKNKVYVNYNDVVLPIESRKLIAKKIRKIDLFLSNFNHAGKIMHPNIESKNIKAELIRNYQENLTFFDIKFLIPFASYHYYRAPESLEQNKFMIELNELDILGHKTIPLKLGSTID